MARHDVVVIGTSAGGVEALQRLASGLPADLPASVSVVLHVPPYLKSVLPAILSRCGQLPAVEAEDEMTLEPGRIHVAAAGHHLLVDRGSLRVSPGPKENGHRPSVDVLFRSAARAYGPRVVAVVLSGLLDDGAAGAVAVKQRGGLLVVQSPEDAAFPDMPLAALQAVGSADYSAPLAELPALLALLCRSEAPDEASFAVPLELEVEDEIAHGAESEARVASLLGEPSTFSCPECGGVLWDLSAQDRRRFRCQVGHAYSAVHLFHAQQAALQQKLWAAVRGLREHALLARQIQQSSARGSWPSLAERFLATATESDRHASELLALLDGLGKQERHSVERTGLMGRKKKLDEDEGGDHPVGVGVGAAGGAATGAVVGSAGGPVGTAVGALVGGVTGGLAGKGIAESINPSFEHEYWRGAYAARPYVREGEAYETFAPAYRYGWESYTRHAGRRFEEVEPLLRSAWERGEWNARLSWERAREAAHDAWLRVERALSGKARELR